MYRNSFLDLMDFLSNSTNRDKAKNKKLKDTYEGKIQKMCVSSC